MSNKAVVVYSGGMDSFTLLNDVIDSDKHDKVYAITFNYGQRHNKEIVYATDVCAELGIEHVIVDMVGVAGLTMGGSSQTDDNISVPEGHYADDNMKLTVVPNRNMIMLSLAMAYCVTKDAGTLYYGAHSGDHHIYEDCRPEFVEAIQQVAKIANYLPIDIQAPYIHGDKITILKRGLELGLNYGKAWTCYNGRDKACGKCGACQERLEAFRVNGVVDPVEYEHDV